jgi:hypothetical protein
MSCVTSSAPRQSPKALVGALVGGLAGAALAVIASVSGCMTPTQNRQDALVRITHEYNDGMRWGRYQDVTRHLAAEEAQKFVARTGTLDDDFEMADDEVTSITFTDGGTRAEVTVNFTWYNQRRSLVRKTLVGQDWRFSDGRWMCVSQRRLRGDRFPLIPEPIAEGSSPPAPH